MNHIFINDRSDLDEIVCIIPRGHKNNQTDADIKVTRREDLQRWSCPRADIVLWTGRSGQQFALYATPNGHVTGDLFILELLSEAQYNEVMAIAQRMARNAEEFEPAAKLLVG